MIATWAYEWRAADEAAFVRYLGMKVNRAALRNYVALGAYRNWGRMDRDVILALAKRWLEGDAK